MEEFMNHFVSDALKSPRIGALFILLFSELVWANDTAVGGEGALPLPVSEPDIRMVKEVIIITGKNLNDPAMNGSWHYSCTFNFENTLNKPLTVDMGFPFPVNDGMSEIAIPAGYNTAVGKALVYNFSITVNDNLISAHKGKIAPNEEKGLYYDEAYLWKTTFPALTTVKIHHDYETGATYDVMGYHWVHYVLKTGALWKNATIGHTRLEVIPDTPTRLCAEIDKSADYLNPVPPGMKITGSGKNRAYIWELPDFKPNQDLSLCLFTGTSYVRYQIILPLINSDNINQKLSSLSPEQLRILRNTVYAQYGRSFQSPDLQNYFNKQWWYEPNPHYSDALLINEDRKLLTLIKNRN